VSPWREDVIPGKPDDDDEAVFAIGTIGVEALDLIDLAAPVIAADQRSLQLAPDRRVLRDLADGLVVEGMTSQHRAIIARRDDGALRREADRGIEGGEVSGVELDENDAAEG